MADLSLNRDSAGVCLLNYLARSFNVLFKALHGSIYHDGSKSEIDGSFACLKALTVVEMQNYRDACFSSKIFELTSIYISSL